MSTPSYATWLHGLSDAGLLAEARRQCEAEFRRTVELARFAPWSEAFECKTECGRRGMSALWWQAHDEAKAQKQAG